MDDLLLLNLLASPPGDDINDVCTLFSRLEQLSYILVWSIARRSSAEITTEASKIAVDLVELPRLQLSFRRVSHQLQCVELPQLTVYKPPNGVWPEDVLVLVEDIPHGLVLISENQQLILLVPNLSICSKNDRLSVNRNDKDWASVMTTRYF
eukprot:2003468-Pleurochrysis_carterae.AAC.1